jgi:hypothetical protein
MARILILLSGLFIIMFKSATYIFQHLLGSKQVLYHKLNKLRNKSKTLQDSLIALEAEDVQLLSYNNEKTKKWAAHKIHTTVYNEPILAINGSISSKEESGVLVAYTSDREYAYVKHKGEIEIFFNSHPFGRILKTGALVDARNKTIGHIDTATQPVLYFNNTPVVRIKPRIKGHLSERMYEVLDKTANTNQAYILAYTLPFAV